jgi:hypothetical protein
MHLSDPECGQLGSMEASKMDARLDFYDRRQRDRYLRLGMSNGSIR